MNIVTRHQWHLPLQVVLLIITIHPLSRACQIPEADSDRLHVLILSGRNNHDWEKTTAVLTGIFEEAGPYEVRVTTRPDTLDAGDLRRFDVVISNWNSWPENDLRWPVAAEQGLLEYVENGGGLVFFHASTSVFYEWPEFAAISTAPWVDGTHHGKKSIVRVDPTDRDHPITKELASFYTFDELWIDAGSNPDFRVLGSASLHREQSPQPAIFVKEHGRGRIFHTILGHDERAMRNTGFKTLIVRGTEWAATGGVKSPVPPRLSSGSAIGDGTYTWQDTDTSLALLRDGCIIWQYNLNTRYGKPFFHPVSPGGTPITWFAPGDHPWHLGQWFSWKFINGINYWEFERHTFRSEGVTEVKLVEVERGSDHSAKIELHIDYHPQGGKTVLREKRTIRVLPPENGRVVMDYDMRFEPVAGRVELDRTPIEGEPEGKSWGGYAGLSIRFNHDLMEPHWISATGNNLAMNGRDDDWLYMGFTDLHGCAAGSAIFIHPDTRREGSAWYLIENPEQPFYYFSPAYLYLEPLTLERGDFLHLRYRVMHIPGKADPGMLRRAYEEYILQIN